MDKFKGALSGQEAAEALRAGFSSALPDAVFHISTLADGGEGTVSILTNALGGTLFSVLVENALGAPVHGQYGYVATSQTALLEMAQASGLASLPITARNPMRTHTFGTGQMILDAIQRGARHFILGIGGSATNDAGMGMACALGYRFFDHQNRALPPCGASLSAVAWVDDSQVRKLPECSFQVACDVDNPLFGATGAAVVYGPQKGATPDMVAQLDHGLQHFASVIKQQFGIDAAYTPGAGAAGGLGYGAMVFLGATLHSGIDLIMQHTRLEEQVAWADLVITGEGKLDTQTIQGKVVSGVARLARAHAKPVVAVCGTLSLSPAQIREMGLSYAESLLTHPLSLEDAQAQTATLLTHWAARFGHFLST